jgi:hypothetical protein
MRSVIIADLVEYLRRVLDGVTLAPTDATVLARVVEAVLRFGSYNTSLASPAVNVPRRALTTVQVNHNF